MALSETKAAASSEEVTPWLLQDKDWSLKMLDFVGVDDVHDVLLVWKKLSLAHREDSERMAEWFVESADVSEIPALGARKMVKGLTLHFQDDYRGIPITVPSLAELGNLQMLKRLTLNFKRCSQLSDVSALAELGGLQNFAQPTLDFSRCSKLSDVSVRAALGGLQNLAQLKLTFGGCEQLTDVSALAELGSLQNLAQLTLNFSKCE